MAHNEDAGKNRSEQAMRGRRENPRREGLAGLLAVSALLLAFVVANSPLDELYLLVHHTQVSLRAGSLGIAAPLIAWINKGLMVFFFLLVGLEIKREILDGRLSDVKSLALPAFAAVGGMAAPATVYLLFTAGTPEAAGWAIPTATDIVLALAVLSVLQRHVPGVLVLFLTTLAIFDDIGGIAVIALFYSEGLSSVALGLAAIAVAGLLALNRAGVGRTGPYVVIGMVLWAAVLKSGVHATLAGVVLAATVPLRVGTPAGDISPLRRMEEWLHPWVTFGVVPVFVFFNAGISLSELAGGDLFTPVSLGVSLGLIVGKPLGILAATWLAVRVGVGRFPEDVSWTHVLGVSLVAGIGFTMSLFITSLAFEAPDALLSGRSAVLAGSLVAAVSGILVLLGTSPEPTQAAPGPR